ncbi:MAG TPA: cation:proton antiporter [Candidatus Wallbacteria bacterium]|mgnify:CR=1 FL=1|nr:cation:proton antiporter [Candidatus Wallbacteria bacterium]
MTLGLFNEIFIIFIISMFVLYFCSRMKIPAIVGYLFTGALLGPYGFRLIHATHEVEYLAEVGVVLLLFTIGIEFSFKKLLQIRKALVLGGFTQVLLTIAAVAFIEYELGFAFKQAVFVGFLVALSSTAIVLKYLQEKAEIDSVYGQTSLAILIFQDIVIVPMILITPLLTEDPAAASAGGDVSISMLLVKIALIVFLIIAATKFIVPQILYHVAKTRNQDLFLLTVIVICASVAVMTFKAGLSLALGAFLAGLVISESEYSHQALGYVLPFKSIFTSFFFVSIGMLLNTSFILSMPWTIAALTLGVVAVKTAAAYIGGALLKVPTGSALLAGFALCQIGEFSFVLSKTGVENKIITSHTYQIFLSVAVLTMILTPAIIYSVHIALKYLVKLKYLKAVPGESAGSAQDDDKGEFCSIKDQLIIIGYGINGQNLARAAKASKIPYVISDVNPETVRREKQNGEPIIYGDATYESVLEHLNVKCAKIIVIAVPDRIAIRRIVELSRKMNHDIYIIARTRFYSEVEEIKKLGADEVIPEEFETSIEIFTRVMQKYLIPLNEIEEFIAHIRKGSYEMLRTPNNSAKITDIEFKMPDIRITTFRVEAHNHFANKTLAEIDLRKKYGLTLVGISRAGGNIINPSGEERILENDVLVFIGDVKQLDVSASAA